MIKNSSTQKGSAHVIIIIILILALLGALGYIFWQNIQSKKEDTAVSTDTTQSVSKDTTKEAVVSTGTIQGSLTYPSEQIPNSLEVHAVNLDTNKEYVTKDQLKGSEYQYGTGYSLDVPVGRYNVYGILSDMPDQKAYYNQYIVCGVKVGCSDTTKIEVKVEAGQKTSGITVGDWWSQP